MLSIAIIIFREALEISLIIGVLMAATRGCTGRSRWIMGGLAAGALGSVVVAFFAEKISGFAEGMGQEIFNASVLALAALLIAYTVLWMARHGRRLTEHFKEAGAAVKAGDKPLHSLAVVAGLAVLREGSEIVLFTFGVLAQGQPAGQVTAGALLGGAAGALAGFAVYFGLVKISVKHVFAATGWLLAFLAAGMMSQAASLLSQAGLLPEMVPAVWDTSGFLPESGFVGRVLHALLGYTERPSLLQLITYLTTLGAVVMLMKNAGRSRPNAKLSVIAALLMAGSLLTAADAHAAKKIYLPYVEKGELELEYQGDYDWDDNAEKDGAHSHKFEVGYGLTEQWFSSVAVELEKERGHETEAEAIEWENKFQISEPGAWWADTGLLVEYAFALENDDADELEVKLLLSKETGPVLHTLNIGFERGFGGSEVNDDGVEIDQEHDLEGILSWSSRYRLRQEFEPGFEYHAGFGSLENGEDFDEQKHQIGPVIYGKIGPVKYDVGVLFGLSDGAPDVELKWIGEYELRF